MQNVALRLPSTYLKDLKCQPIYHMILLKMEAFLERRGIFLFTTK